MARTGNLTIANCPAIQRLTIVSTHVFYNVELIVNSSHEGRVVVDKHRLTLARFQFINANQTFHDFALSNYVGIVGCKSHGLETTCTVPPPCCEFRPDHTTRKAGCPEFGRISSATHSVKSVTSHNNPSASSQENCRDLLNYWQIRPLI